MNVTNTYSGSLTIQANGGNGGNEDDDNSSGRCYGAGGGGSGGVIYFNGAVPAVTTSYTGGTAGINIDPLSCGTPAPASNGTNGLQVPNYSYQTSLIPSASCSVALPVRLIYFNAILINEKKIKLEWDIADPGEANSFVVEKLNTLNQWISINNIAANANIHHYECADNGPVNGDNIYRLKIVAKNNSHIYSTLKRVVINVEEPFLVYPNPASGKIVIKGNMNQNTMIKITDITGREIKKIITNTSLNSCEILLPRLDTGIYLLHVNNYIEKILILH
jgi:hypothetical protein